ncbi:MAG: peptide ABC transporter substrate-binding protein [Thermomicrobiales bacterium]|nr:peptide ABC transporter substrate-binding protein [Thermomicrobiales bacterium]
MRNSPSWKPARAARIGAAIAFTLALLTAPAGAADPRGATPTPVVIDGAVGGAPVVLEATDARPAATPTGEQTIRLAGPTDPIDTFDPALAKDATAAFFARQLFRGLTRLDADLNAVPELAERIEISADGLTYTFALRPGATFQDGSPILAADVIGSLTRALSPATTGGEATLLGGPTYLSDIEGAADVVAGRAETLRGARALDDRTVEIRLAHPRATFLMKLAAAAASIVDVEQAAADPEWWRQPNTSGPFRIAGWEPDEALTLEAVPGFAPGAPHLERVEFRLGPNAGNAFNLYQADQLDVAGAPFSAVDRILEADPETVGNLSIAPMFATEYIAFRTDVAPMDDPEFRKAIALAFPRAQFSEVALAGQKLAATGLVPPGMLGRDWDDPMPPYDPGAARAALERSRYGDGQPVPPLQIYGLGTIGATTLRDTVGKTLGIEIDVISVEWPTFAAGLANREFPAYELHWIADYPDPETFLWSLFDSRSPDNYVGYNNPEFDALLDAAAATIDVDERADLYERAQGLLVDDGVILPILHDVRYTVMRPAVHGLVETPLGILYLDDVWMEH